MTFSNTASLVRNNSSSPSPTNVSRYCVGKNKNGVWTYVAVDCESKKFKGPHHPILTQNS